MITKANVVRDFRVRSEAAIGVADAGRVEVSRSPSFVDLGGPSAFRSVSGWLARLTNAQLALLVSAVLFAVGAWPLALVGVPPLQDLPNHLAAITIIQHPERYPDLVFNGFLKTNTALFAWLYFVGKVVGLEAASRTFVLLVLAATALVLPRFVLELTGSRQRMVMASFFAWPFVHNWFVSMGMLDYALGVPLSLFSLLLLERQRVRWSWPRAAAIAVVAVATWYAHVFTLMVVHLLVGLHVLSHALSHERARGTWRQRLHEARLLVPLLPATVLVVVSLLKHMTEPDGAMHGFVSFAAQIPPWELLYNLWAEWLWGFTKLSITSIVAGAGLVIVCWVNRRERPTFFGPTSLVVMLAMYVCMPYVATNWFHVNSRLIPYLWMAALLRVPARVDRRALGFLALCGVLYSAGMGVDYLRLDRDREKFTAGIAAVPKDAHLLPLLFSRQLTSENTRSLLHAWGYYVVEKQTDAPLLFAHSRSFPVMYRVPPPTRFNHLVLESFAQNMRNPDWVCSTLRGGGVVVDCPKAWRAAWAEFWAEALPRYDHVLLWDVTPDALSQVPKQYKVAFQQDRLTILARDDSASPAPVSAR